MKKNWYQGIYEVVNKNKYIGNSKPIYRSSWEKRLFFFADTNTNVVRWGSEIIVIPYYYNVDKKMHRYYTDLYVEIKQNDGKIKKYVVELKPSDQLEYPVEPKRKTTKSMQSYKYKLLTAEKNKCKFAAAKQYCETNGYEFKIITEKELF